MNAIGTWLSISLDFPDKNENRDDDVGDDESLDTDK